MDEHNHYQAVMASFAPVLTHGTALFVCFFSMSKQSDKRGYIFVPIAMLFLLGTYLATDFVPHHQINNIFARYQLIVLGHMSFLHCIVSSEELEEERGKYGPNGPHRNWTFAYKMMWNTLCRGTRWEVTVRSHKAVKVPHTTATNPPSPEANPDTAGRALQFVRTSTSISRRSFVTRRAIVLLFRYILLCIYYDPSLHFVMPGNRNPTHDDYSASKSVLSRQLFCVVGGVCDGPEMARVAVLRFHTLLEYVVPDYLILSSYHDILSIVAVGLLRIDTPEEWPPLFGDITQAYTVRRYWSKFWHLLIYRAFSAHAALVTSKILGVRARSLAARYVNNCLVFVLSGLMHLLVDSLLEPGDCSRCGCSGMFWWFSMQPVAMIAEAVVQDVYRRVQKRLMPQRQPTMCVRRVEQAIGYVWVVLWLVWSIERTRFPIMYCLTASSK